MRFGRSLKIDKNGLTSLSTLPLLPALEELDVTGNPIGNVKHELVHLGTVVPRLQVLTLGVTTGTVLLHSSRTRELLSIVRGCGTNAVVCALLVKRPFMHPDRYSAATSLSVHPACSV